MMAENPNERQFRGSKLMIAAVITTGALTTLPIVNMIAENLRDNHYYVAWVERGTQEQRESYWRTSEPTQSNLLIPFSFMFQNRYKSS